MALSYIIWWQYARSEAVRWWGCVGLMWRAHIKPLEIAVPTPLPHSSPTPPLHGTGSNLAWHFYAMCYGGIPTLRQFDGVGEEDMRIMY